MSYVVVDRDQQSNDKSTDDVLSLVMVVPKPIEKGNALKKEEQKNQWTLAAIVTRHSAFLIE